MKSGISTTETDPQRLWQRVRASADIVGADLVKDVTCSEPYEWPLEVRPHTSHRFHIVVMDYGVKYNILRQLASLGCKVTGMPFRA